MIAVPTAFVALAYQSWLAVTGNPGARWLQNLAAFGGTVGVFAIGYFLLQLRSALVTAQARKRFGFIWDVGTFFPRACAPFGPPSYAERSVPEIVTRIRRDRRRRDPRRGRPGGRDAASPSVPRRVPDDRREAHTGVLLVGYSQGTPISVAVMAQLPVDVVAPDGAADARRAGAPAVRADLPGVLRSRRTRGAARALGADARWRNLVRRSDYIGGWVLEPPGPAAAIDVEIHDPPVLWGDHDPSPPPTHRHSDWFPDPQTRPYADRTRSDGHRPSRPRPPPRRRARAQSSAPPR